MVGRLSFTVVTRNGDVGVLLVMSGAVVAFEWPEADVSAAVEALYRAEGRRLVVMLTAFLGDRSLAEDLTQEAFARVQRGWHQIRDTDHADRYLRTTAFNLARSSLRRRRALAPMVELVSRLTPEDRVVLDEQHQAVIDAVLRLPTRQRACVVLRYYRELGVEDIAETLGISSNSVKTHLVRGLDRLEAALGATR